MKLESGGSEEGSREDAAVMARICWAYFKEGQTQEAIAQRLGLTRKRVNRVLTEARTSGFVKITIDAPVGACAELEERLAASFGLQRAIVVPAPPPDIDVRTVVGAAAGQYVSTHLVPGGSLGITWGGTINAAAQNVIRRESRAIPSCCCAAGWPAAPRSIPTTTPRCSRARSTPPATT